MIGEAELNFWMQPQHPLASDARWGGTYRQNMKTLATIKDRIRTVKPDGEGVPGIAAIATPGHMPGHTSVQIASASNQLLCTAGGQDRVPKSRITPAALSEVPAHAFLASPLREEFENRIGKRCRIATRRIMIEIRKSDLPSSRYALADPFIDQLIVCVCFLSTRDQRWLREGRQRVARDGRRWRRSE